MSLRPFPTPHQVFELRLMSVPDASYLAQASDQLEGSTFKGHNLQPDCHGSFVLIYAHNLEQALYNSKTKGAILADPRWSAAFNLEQFIPPDKESCILFGGGFWQYVGYNWMLCLVLEPKARRLEWYIPRASCDSWLWLAHASPPVGCRFD